MILNTQIWNATKQAAQAAVVSKEWANARARALKELETAYYRWEGETLVLTSTSGNTYRLTAKACACKAAEKGHVQCWHRAALGLIRNYESRLAQSAPVCERRTGTGNLLRLVA